MIRLRRGGSAGVARVPVISSFNAGRGRFGAAGVLSLGGSALGLGVLVGLTLTGAPAHAAFPGTNGKILCQGSLNRGSNPEWGTTWGLFTINPDGSQYTLLTNNGGAAPGQRDPDDVEPAYSPDGTKIAFDSVRTGGSEIWTMNADGTDLRRLTAFIFDDAAPHWSPDGRQLVWTAFRDGNQAEVYRMNADGSGQTRLTFNPGADGRASWSPDGTKIAFETRRRSPTDPADATTFNTEIATMNPDGSGINLLTDTQSPVGHRSTRWSPDGRQILFDSNRAQPGPTPPSNNDVYKMNRDGSGITRLTTNAGNGLPGSATDQLAQFSPDGTKIVFDTNRHRDPEPPPNGTANSEVYTMNPDGSGERRVTNQPGTDQRCDWQPIPRPATVYPPIYPKPPVTPPGGKHRTSLTLKAKPRRDRRPPFRFTFSGRVRIPGGVSAAAVCGGRVRLVLRKGRRTVARGTARVSKRCTYRKRITIKTTKRTGRRRARLRVTARFGGNAFLSAASRKSTTVRIF